jgi:hypothetical protein
MQAGFECSSHKIKSGKRLDLISSTRHDRFAAEDYARLGKFGIRTVREGLRWHLIEKEPGKYDFSSALAILRPALEAEVEVIWDLLHFGWPDHLDVFDPAWVASFREFASRFARLLKSELGTQPAFIAPVNEISFVAWAGGDAGYINPFTRGRGGELKAQLVRAAIQATHAVREELPDVRIVSPEPVIHIVGDPGRPEDVRHAEEYRLAMFQAWDMLTGRVAPELGGTESCLDIIGVNFYDRNQWWNFGKTIWRGEPQYRPFHQILKEVYDRYQRPMFVSETGTEEMARPEWFAYIASEVRTAIELGVPMHGICLYPILNHPGWDDDRHCYNGLWDYASENGMRQTYKPLAEEISKQEEIRKNTGKGSQSMKSNLQNHDLICISHLPWRFVFQRPQHLMSRFARQRRVFYIEEPVYGAFEQASVETKSCPNTGVNIVTPHLPEALQNANAEALKQLMQELFLREGISRYIAWFYTPMALEFCDWLTPEVTVYDCMDELSLFRNAPATLRENEQRLFRLSDLVFTGGVSLFEAKCRQHSHVYAFPSSVDVAHFAQARMGNHNPEDQTAIPRPRLGYAGVIDERMDLDLIDYLAAERPDWHIVMVGPVVKIDQAGLPRRPNIHWLGMKDYQQLPAYFAGWDVALLPFALNDSTRFISPTKTPEYLAAGLPVVSTPIRDVVRPYGELGLARIAFSREEFLTSVEQAMAHGMSMKWRERADTFLKTSSWDDTWGAMNKLIEEILTVSRAAGQDVAGIESQNLKERAVHV